MYVLMQEVTDDKGRTIDHAYPVAYAESREELQDAIQYKGGPLFWTTHKTDPSLTVASYGNAYHMIYRFTVYPVNPL
jgi:hypothetical protein